ncbi:SufS subfamily cysteine desulfurase [Nitzschia inconspicua]|uniref:SufS subfamily cysteine desulfurase n=1 Tax=Nitzschia inconspicua TaxID=303405 RepID=A0A9K3K649_9STRA|nr:SufS subfamily cysteine desulfurase [Nitzschia inconspicua]
MKDSSSNFNQKYGRKLLQASREMCFEYQWTVPKEEIAARLALHNSVLERCKEKKAHWKDLEMQRKLHGEINVARREYEMVLQTQQKVEENILQYLETVLSQFQLDQKLKDDVEAMVTGAILQRAAPLKLALFYQETEYNARHGYELPGYGESFRSDEEIVLKNNGVSNPRPPSVKRPSKNYLTVNFNMCVLMICIIMALTFAEAINTGRGDESESMFQNNHNSPSYGSFEEQPSIVMSKNSNTSRAVPQSDGSCLAERLSSIASWDILGLLMVFLAVIGWKIRSSSTRERLKPRKVFDRHINISVNTHASAALKRKKDFLSRYRDEYGYRDSPIGFIDEWRPVEFPGLQPPLEFTTTDWNSNIEEKEVYLDYAGSALPAKSQLERIYRDNSSTILANPHSTGPAAARTLHKIQSSSGENHEPSAMDCHAGYEVVFTSGATEGCRIVAERFPWQTARLSILLYVTNSHTSVVGMRQLALAKGAIFYCVDVATLESMTVDDFWMLERKLLQDLDGNTSGGRNSDGEINQRRNLLVFPAECNFGGHRTNSASILAVAKHCGWYTMLDIAKAASTGPVSLRELDPDFAVLSFYKIFGEPTGIGALFLKRSSFGVLFEHDDVRYYQGGGSVDIMTPRQDYTVPKRESPTACLDSLTNGTIHFRGIISLTSGLETLEGLGGMDKIQQHTNCLKNELVGRLKSLKHGNGVSVIRLYGAWQYFDDRNDNITTKSSASGPTVTFNVIRADGSVVGYNEVSKLAALHRPTIQFRTGCFCNPGACQQALGLSDEQVINNFEQAGHVCGDHLDLVNGQPTGAVRISFGKDSLWEDLDVVVQFLQRNFVNEESDASCEQDAQSTHGHISTETVAKVSSIFIFPIKSCAAQQVSRWQVELPSGKLRYDREFALVDTSGTALRLQTCPKLGLISPKIDTISNTMTVSAPGCDDLLVKLGEDLYHGGENAVQLCGNKCGGKLWGDAFVSDWFSSFLGIHCWLARYSTTQSDTINAGGKTSRAGFSNEHPILLVSEHAVDALNTVLLDQGHHPVDSKRFRPNIVVKTENEFERGQHIEDNWKVLSLANQNFSFKVEGPCPRCTMVDYDPVTGKKGKTLRALASYRRRNGSIVFGIFLKANRASANEQLGVWIEQGDVLQYDHSEKIEKVPAAFFLLNSQIDSLRRSHLGLDVTTRREDFIITADRSLPLKNLYTTINPEMSVKGDVSNPAEKRVKVFILLGQSNMVGMGKVTGAETDGTLEYAVKTKHRYSFLVDEKGNWKKTINPHVRNVFTMGSGTGVGKLLKNEWMTIEQTNKIGPEIGIGYELGKWLSESPSCPCGDNDNILILKSCIGNRSLGWDLLPPGSPSFEYFDEKKKITWHYAGYKESPNRWEKGTQPVPIGWYAGMQYDGDIDRARTVLADLPTYIPGSTPSTKYEVAGFFYWQGDKDRYDTALAQRYKINLVHLIRRLRLDFDSPNAKFVLATLGQTSMDGAKGNDAAIFNAQMSVQDMPEFSDNTTCVYSQPFCHGGASNSHYNGNAETYMDVGQAMGRAMVSLLEK